MSTNTTKAKKKVDKSKVKNSQLAKTKKKVNSSKGKSLQSGKTKKKVNTSKGKSLQSGKTKKKVNTSKVKNLQSGKTKKKVNTSKVKSPQLTKNKNGNNDNKNERNKKVGLIKSHSLFIRAILLFGGFLSLINVGFMYTVANPTIGFTLQAIISIALIFYAIFFTNFHKILHMVILILFLILLAFSTFLGVYGNQSQVDYTEDVVIVLGAGVNGTMVSRPLAHRLNTAVDYWQNNPKALIIVTGGLGNRATITEAEAMARFLIRRGIPEEMILLEELSTNTYENLVFANEIALEYFPDGFQGVLITNDFHIYRASRIAGQVGVNVHPLGATTDWYSWPVNYLREMLAVLNFKIFGL